MGVLVVVWGNGVLNVGYYKKSEVKIDRDRVIVVDNASGDNSVEQIQQTITENNWSQWVQLLPSSVNGGFSAGNNLGIKAVAADAYLLLNSDTIVHMLK